MFNGVLILEGVTIDDVGWYVCYTNGSKTRVMTGAKLDVDKSLGMKNQFINLHIFMSLRQYRKMIELFYFYFS